MSKGEYQAWANENIISSVTKWFNGIQYIWGTMKDGWIAISEIDAFGVYPCIQADNEAHAESWCAMRERINVPMQQIC